MKVNLLKYKKKRKSKFHKRAQKRKNIIQAKILQVLSNNIHNIDPDLAQRENLKDKNLNEKREWTVKAKARALAKVNLLALNSSTIVNMLKLKWLCQENLQMIIDS